MLFPGNERFIGVLGRRVALGKLFCFLPAIWRHCIRNTPSLAERAGITARIYSELWVCTLSDSYELYPHSLQSSCGLIDGFTVLYSSLSLWLISWHWWSGLAADLWSLTGQSFIPLSLFTCISEDTVTVWHGFEDQCMSQVILQVCYPTCLSSTPTNNPWPFPNQCYIIVDLALEPRDTPIHTCVLTLDRQVFGRPNGKIWDG